MKADDFILGLRYVLARTKREFKDWDEYNIVEIEIDDQIMSVTFSDAKAGKNCISFDTGKSMENYRRAVTRAVSLPEIESFKRLNFDIESVLRRNYEL